MSYIGGIYIKDAHYESVIEKILIWCFLLCGIDKALLPVQIHGVFVLNEIITKGLFITTNAMPY